MNIIRKPLSLLDDFDLRFNDILPKYMTQPDMTWKPLVDIQEEADKYVIHADIPGVKPEDIDIKIENNTLSIKGEKQSSSEEKESNYTKVERFSGSFYRQFSLPSTVDAEHISAKANDGVLTITVLKTSPKSATTIKVDTDQ